MLGKLRSSVLARRHAPATPESTDAARGAAPQGGFDDDVSNDVQLKKETLVTSVADAVLAVDVRLRRPIVVECGPWHGPFPL